MMKIAGQGGGLAGSKKWLRQKHKDSDGLTRIQKYLGGNGQHRHFSLLVSK